MAFRAAARELDMASACALQVWCAWACPKRWAGCKVGSLQSRVSYPARARQAVRAVSVILQAAVGRPCVALAVPLEAAAAAAGRALRGRRTLRRPCRRAGARLVLVVAGQARRCAAQHP